MVAFIADAAPVQGHVSNARPWPGRRVPAPPPGHLLTLRGTTDLSRRPAS